MILGRPVLTAHCEVVSWRRRRRQSTVLVSSKMELADILPGSLQ
jgi:hypothetical protein